MKAVIERIGETPAAPIFPEPETSVQNVPAGCCGGYPYILPQRGRGRDRRNTKAGGFILSGT